MSNILLISSKEQTERREGFAAQLRQKGYHTVTTESAAPGALMSPINLIVLITRNFDETAALLRTTAHLKKPLLIWCEGAFRQRDSEYLARQYNNIKGILAGERFPKTEDDLFTSLRQAMLFLF